MPRINRIQRLGRLCIEKQEWSRLEKIGTDYKQRTYRGIFADAIVYIFAQLKTALHAKKAC